MMHLFLKLPAVLAAVGQVQNSLLKITLDVMLMDKLFYRIHSLQPHIPEPSRYFTAKLLFKVVLIFALADSHVPTIAPRGAKTNAFRFQNDH